MRPNSITLLTDQFLGSRNGFVTYKGSSHKLIPYLSKRMGRIYVSPEDRTIILPRVAETRISSAPVSPVSALPAVSFEQAAVSAAQNSRAAVMYFFIIRQP